MRFKKLQLFLLILFSSLVVFGQISEVKATGSQILPLYYQNDFIYENWQLSEEIMLSQNIENSLLKNIKFSSTSGDMLLNYIPPMSKDMLMTEFFINPDTLDGGKKIIFTIFSKTEEYYSLTTELNEDNYDVVLNIDENEYTLSSVEYSADYGLQLRLAYEEITDFETYTKKFAWNFVAGCDKATNKKVNIFSKADFIALEEKLNKIKWWITEGYKKYIV